MHPVSISGYHIREAGSTAAQELAFTLADGFAYVDAALERGLDVDEFAPRLSFFFNAHIDFFEEIAKYRAARRIWARELRDRYGAKNPRSWLMRFHTQTAGVSLTAQQPRVNIVRTAIEALAAVLGGTQSLHTNSFDEALALPTEDAVRIALRTQQVIAHETGVAHTIDPLGGCYYLEDLTNRLEAEAYDYFRPDRRRSAAWSRRSRTTSSSARSPRRRSATRPRSRRSERIVVGVNHYELDEDEPIPILRIDPALEREQIERVQAVRARRDAAAVEACVAELKRSRGRRPQPHGADPGRRQGVRDDGRDVRRFPRGLGRLAGDSGLLTSPLPWQSQWETGGILDLQSEVTAEPAVPALGFRVRPRRRHRGGADRLPAQHRALRGRAEDEPARANGDDAEEGDARASRAPGCGRGSS